MNPVIGERAERKVFVVGMNGSGTTMLADSLGRHEALYMFPFESKVIPLFLQRAPRYGDLREHSNRRRLADDIGASLPFWRANGRHPLHVPDAVIAQVVSVPAMFCAIFGHLAASAGKTGWVEKSPVNTENLPLLSEVFPDAKFIHIIRDGRDAAQSFHRRWGFDPRHTVWRWKKTVRQGRADGVALGKDRYLEMRYEDLTDDPERHMRKVCEFLGLPYSPEVLGSSMRHMAPDAPADGRIVPNSMKWQQYFGAGLQLDLERIAGRELEALGYPVTTAGDHDFSPQQLRLLRAKDMLMRSVGFFRDRGIGGLPMYFRLARSALQTRASRRF
jgi:Sulfotransferase family